MLRGFGKDINANQDLRSISDSKKLTSAAIAPNGRSKEKENADPHALKLTHNRREIKKDPVGMWELNIRLCDLLDSGKWWSPILANSMSRYTKEIVEIARRIIEKHAANNGVPIAGWRSGVASSSSSFAVLSHIDGLVNKDAKQISLIAKDIVEEVVKEQRPQLDISAMQDRCDYLISECAKLFKSFKPQSKERHKFNIFNLIEIIATAVYLLEKEENALDCNSNAGSLAGERVSDYLEEQQEEAADNFKHKLEEGSQELIKAKIELVASNVDQLATASRNNIIYSEIKNRENMGRENIVQEENIMYTILNQQILRSIYRAREVAAILQIQAQDKLDVANVEANGRQALGNCEKECYATIKQHSDASFRMAIELTKQRMDNEHALVLYQHERDKITCQRQETEERDAILCVEKVTREGISDKAYNQRIQNEKMEREKLEQERKKKEEELEVQRQAEINKQQQQTPLAPRPRANVW